MKTIKTIKTFQLIQHKKYRFVALNVIKKINLILKYFK
jgi:hypothetical protein